jgi:hypothetical protein
LRRELDMHRAHERLVLRILGPDGEAAPELRTSAFDNAELPQPLGSLLRNVARVAGHLTDDDINVAKAAGYSDDQLFELVICAAVGAATRQYEAGLSALARIESTGQ